MSKYESAQNRRRSQSRQRPEQPRSQRKRAGSSRRSVGATTISASGARNIGLTPSNIGRAYGRGTTARRVEERHRSAASDRLRRKGNDELDTRGKEGQSVSRPAVYTADAPKEGLVSRLGLSRLRLPEFHMPSLSVTSIPIPLVAFLALVIVAVVVFGPARTYYVAWREAGVLDAEYAALASQNEELNHEIERLQTRQGIEDEARNRGYVYPDEEALVVEGMEPKQVADPALVDAAVAEHEKSLPWYIGLLDMLFGYTRE
ncbi:MAG: septum formation initiator family protein [Atopobiaceae bacterium]|nr:septum formation initiator family protein [Atopobiaceae bacterium]